MTTTATPAASTREAATEKADVITIGKLKKSVPVVKRGGLTILDADGLTTEITPEMAERLMEGRGNNRNVRPTVVERYADDMEQERWGDHSVIRISREDGKVLDGQHRLTACIATGKPFRAIVLLVDPEDILTTDIGATRRLADMIKFDNPEERNVAAVASIVVAHAAWDGEEFRASAEHVSVPALVDRYRANPGMYHEAASKVSHVYRYLRSGKGFPASQAMLGLAYIVIKEKALDPAWVDEFFEEWVSDDYKGSDVLGVLNQALNPRSKPLPSVNVYSGRRRFLAIVLKGWNAWSMGESPQRITFNMGGPSKVRESFPKIMPGLAEEDEEHHHDEPQKG